MIIYGHTQESLNSVPVGGTFYLDAPWNCAKEGPMHITRAINITGGGGIRANGAGWTERYGPSVVMNHHAGAENAMFFDLSREDESHGISITNLSFYHTSRTHHAIRMRHTPQALLDHLYIDSAWGRGGLFYDEYCFFMTARNVVIRDFTGEGVRIVGNGNDYTFDTCTISSRRRSGQDNTAECGIHCVNSGLVVRGGAVSTQNDLQNGVGIRLMYDRTLRPMSGGSALLQGVYAENTDIAVQIDATPGHQWDGAHIIYPHWAMQRHRGFTRGVDVVRGKNIYIESPQLYDWTQATSDMVVLHEDSNNCLVRDATHNISGFVTDSGVGNRVE